MRNIFNILAVVQNTATASSGMNVVIIGVIVMIIVLVCATMFLNKK